MFKKRLFLGLLVLSFIISLGFVSAVDNETILDESPNEITLNDKISTFHDIQEAIDNADDNSTITLDGIYRGEGSEIHINKDIKIEASANGATLDAGGASRIFNISKGKVILNNLNFINARSRATNGGAILSDGQLVVLNSNFINNSVYYNSDVDFDSSKGQSGSQDYWNSIGKGGAICANKDLSVINCSFINNAAYSIGEVRDDGDYYIVDDGDGSAIFSKAKLYLENSHFYYHYVASYFWHDGGMILALKNAKVVGCTFENISSVFKFEGNLKASFINSTFENVGEAIRCAASYEGSIAVDLQNCNFTRNHDDLILYPDTLTLDKCLFLNNTAQYYVVNAKNAKITDSNFINNHVDDTAILQFEKYLLKNNLFTNNSDATIFSKKQLLDDSLNPVCLFTPVFVNKISKTYHGSGEKILINVLNNRSKKPGGFIVVTVKRNGKSFYYSYESRLKLDISKWDVGTYNVLIRFADGHHDLKSSISPNEMEFTVTIKKAQTIVKAPKVTVKYKKSGYFKVSVIHKATNKAVKNLKVKVKVYTGKKYKTYAVKTDKNGMAKLNTKVLSWGTHKVEISSGNSNYKIKAKSTIKIR